VAVTLPAEGITAGDVARALDRTADARLDVQLEVETGLGRGGVDPAALVTVAGELAARPGIVLTGVWTHLAAPEDAASTAAQVARFEGALARLRAAGIRVPGRHVAATGGLLSGVAALDAIRPGLAVYGIVPDDLAGERLDAPLASRLRPAMSLVARPVRVADLGTGHGVSYGPSFRTDRPSRIATLPVGYGDGWSRSLSNRASAIVRGVRVPLVGTVAMDAVMADVTDVPGLPVGPDDEFVLLGSGGGDRIGAIEVARRRTTISWEVVSTMARRMPRVYDAAAGLRGVRSLASRS
jgi:alanine racemase